MAQKTKKLKKKRPTSSQEAPSTKKGTVREAIRRAERDMAGWKRKTKVSDQKLKRPLTW